MEYCPTDWMVADIMTKPLPYVKHDHFRSSMGLKDGTSGRRYIDLDEWEKRERDNEGVRKPQGWKKIRDASRALRQDPNYHLQFPHRVAEGLAARARAVERRRKEGKSNETTKGEFVKFVVN